MLHSPAGILPGGGLWDRFKPKSKEVDGQPKTPQMALARQRLLTLCFGDLETVRMLPLTYADLEAVARDWTRPPEGTHFALRIPVEYASLHASRLVTTPYIYLTGEDSYQIAIMGVQGLRVEIVSDGPPPEEPPAAPPEPVLEMPATFNLELAPGQNVALDVSVASDELDMARMDDGTTVDGSFWGKLDIIHDGDTHQLEFSGTRIVAPDLPLDLLVDSRVISKLASVSKPPVAKCNLSLYYFDKQDCEVTLAFSPFWKIGMTWPPAERADTENQVKYFLRVNPGGALEHYESQIVTSALYYEAIPDSAMVVPSEYISPKHGFAMPTPDFLRHLTTALDQLGLSVHARTNFLNNNLAAFSLHKNIAYRFLPANRVAAAVDITVTLQECNFTRLFLLFRGLTDDELGDFATAGEKEANSYNWRQVIGWSENAKDPSIFRVLELSILDIS